MLDLHPIRAVLEAAGSQLIALLFRVVMGEFFLFGAGNFEVISNLLSSTIFSIVLAVQLYQLDLSFVLSNCRCPLYKL